jgi:hypothetical protein
MGPPDDPTQRTIVSSVVALVGTQKARVYYEWVPTTFNLIWTEFGHRERVDPPAPGSGDGTAAASTTTSGSGSPARTGPATGSGPAAVVGPTGTLGVFTGGRSASGDPSSTLAYVFDHLTGALTISAMGVPRSDHETTTLLDGRVLLVGGNESNHSELFDPATGTFTPGPDMSTVHGYGLSATLLMDGRVLLIGGGQNEADGPLTNTEVFNPLTGTFSPGRELPKAMIGGAAVSPKRQGS